MFQFNSVEPLLVGPNAGGNIKSVNYGLYFGTPYTYSLNNPVKFVDRDGEFGFLILLGIAAGALLSADYANAPGPDDDIYSLSTFEYVVDTAVPALGGTAAGGAIDRSIQSAPSDVTNQGYPNPEGSKGKQDHQDAVKKMNQDFEKEIQPGEVVKRERKLEGHDSSRRPDAQIVDQTGKARKVGEVERNPNSKYNEERKKEYEGLGLEYEERNLD